MIKKSYVKILDQSNRMIDFNNQLKVTKYTNKKKGPIPKEWTMKYFKEYARLDKIKILESNLNKIDLLNVLKERSSTRKFSNEKISYKEISEVIQNGILERENQKRPYPSGGARYPIETYIISNNSELKNGIYHLNHKNKCLEIMSQRNVDLRSIFNQEHIFKSSLIIVFTAVFNRTFMKYYDRGYRYILIEAGHIGQNIELLCTGLNIGCCAIGGFIDDKLNNLLNIKSEFESVLYVYVLGKK